MVDKTLNIEQNSQEKNQSKYFLYLTKVYPIEIYIVDNWRSGKFIPENSSDEFHAFIFKNTLYN